MKIYKAHHLGFCYGVKRSISLANRDYGKKVYTYGKLIHNSRMVAALEKMGIHAINDMSEAEPGSVVILRSHGAPVEEIEKAKNTGLEIVDATCPFVMRTRKIVEEKYADGYKIVMFGKAEHPEVIGIKSICKYTATVI